MNWGKKEAKRKPCWRGRVVAGGPVVGGGGGTWATNGKGLTEDLEKTQKNKEERRKLRFSTTKEEKGGENLTQAPRGFQKRGEKTREKKRKLGKKPKTGRGPPGKGKKKEKI